MYMKNEEDIVEPRYSGIKHVFIGLLALMILILGVIPGFLIEIADRTAVTVF